MPSGRGCNGGGAPLPSVMWSDCRAYGYRIRTSQTNAMVSDGRFREGPAGRAPATDPEAQRDH
jgi:hypothetical protein